MTERSYLWTTGGAGDGAATYTRQDWQRIVQVLSGTHGWEGVSATLLNTLSITFPSANTATVATGAAIVDGKPYYNDASVNITVPSAVGGGNTRIDRIVLRADWTAQTVRLTRIAGTDAASPTAPSMTTSSGSTYDVPLYQVRVNTSGTVTLELEEINYAQIEEGDIGTGAIYTNNIAANSVDDTIVGDRVPQFYRRQGGNSTHWGGNFSNAGSGTTTYTPGAVRMQGGSVSVNVTGTSATLTVTFPTAFSGRPIVLATPGNSALGDITVLIGGNAGDLSTTAVTFVITTQVAGGATPVHIHWLAIGPE